MALSAPLYIIHIYCGFNVTKRSYTNYNPFALCLKLCLCATKLQPQLCFCSERNDHVVVKPVIWIVKHYIYEQRTSSVEVPGVDGRYGSMQRRADNPHTTS